MGSLELSSMQIACRPARAARADLCGGTKLLYIVMDIGRWGIFGGGLFNKHQPMLAEVGGVVK